MINITNYYEGRDLGCCYASKGSMFKVWAPTASLVSLVIYKDSGRYNRLGQVTRHNEGTEIVMVKDVDGVWSSYCERDLKGLFYMYKTEFTDGIVHYVVDPYAKAVSANGERTAIVDLKMTDPLGWDEDVKPALCHPTDSILYELHVRDFSIHPDSGVVNKGGFKAFTEFGLKDVNGNTLGIDHLEELGVTHIQIMPVFDFKTVNELNVGHQDASISEYNWGYDPQNYNVPEGSYASDASNPAIRIIELKEMIQALHRKGIRIIMDVVYNHTYLVEGGPFETIVPGYFYRTDDSGRYTDGSGVGNELATERPMVRKYIKDSVRYWAEEYHIDGFRFDLMGLIDTLTMKEIADELHDEVDRSIMIYGEPWTGGLSPLTHQTLKGTQRGTKISMFNDHFRSAIKGDSDGTGRGFATGESGKEWAIWNGVCASIHDFTESPMETINYVTVHDNLNLWDKVLTTEGLRQEAGMLDIFGGLRADSVEVKLTETADPYKSVDPKQPLTSDVVRRSLLANGIILTSQGIPLIHAGDEMLRSKFGDHNSYQSGDSINGIRWDNKGKFQAVFEYYRGLIELRNNHPAFRMHTRAQIEKHLEMLQCSGNVVAYQLKNHAHGDIWRNIVVIYNGNKDAVAVDIPESTAGWNITVNDQKAGTSLLERVIGDTVLVPRLSIMVLYQEQRPTLLEKRM
ncbi:type I pullulanase [Paenibacillus sp. FA6]|uniref:type I pullulanase n=1 Tax=Paenibacillus sp. FA6 TaxID=3413029 RepID=UPI003F65531F